MANEIEALLGRVEDEALRRDLKAQFDHLSRKRQFGLVFEEHLPERVALTNHPVRRGTKVVPRDDQDAEPRLVLAVADRQASLPTEDGEPEWIPLDDLIAVAEFGEPVHPGLRRLGSVDRGGDKPAHVVIKGENYHALEALRFTHAGRVDCIYIDPPYNTGARDWKYNNDYVDGDDAYRHSKWLAMMQRRLLVAKDLLNPENSVLIVTIDEKEFLRLGMLLEQLFPGRKMQMISSVINPRGIVRGNEFSRSNEFIFFLWSPRAHIAPAVIKESEGQPVAWETMRRRSIQGARGRKGRGACGPNQFYAIHVDENTGHIVGRGDPLPPEARVEDYVAPEGCVAVFPARNDGSEMNWSLTDLAFDDRWPKGYVRAGKATLGKPQKYIIQYLLGGVVNDIKDGRVEVTGHDESGAVVAEYATQKTVMPHAQWDIVSHNAQQYGTGLLDELLPARKFPYAKSLYAVEDAVRFFVANKPDAVVLDFFAGSGTTAHAVARLNHQDGGQRRSISVTNNEVSAAEAKRLRDVGHRPGDAEWEALGIFEHITRPRITAAVTGRTPDGEPIKGDYKFTDEFPMAEGFEENVEFLRLTYVDAEDVELDLAFANVAPLLWMRAGSQGPVIEERCDDAGDPLPYATTDRYAVLFDPDHWRSFVEQVPSTVTTVFVVTDSATVFAGVASEFPSGLDVVRLYENYLSTFTVNQGAPGR